MKVTDAHRLVKTSSITQIRDLNHKSERRVTDCTIVLSELFRKPSWLILQNSSGMLKILYKRTDSILLTICMKQTVNRKFFYLSYGLNIILLSKIVSLLSSFGPPVVAPWPAISTLENSNSHVTQNTWLCYSNIKNLMQSLVLLLQILL